LRSDLIRLYDRFKVLDFIQINTFGVDFMQISLSEFSVHDTKGAAFRNAFIANAIEYGYSIITKTPRNQIEFLLESLYGTPFTAEYKTDGKFLIKNAFIDNNTTIWHDVSRNVRFVYICGKKDKPNHTGKVKDYPDLLHINYEELRQKLGFDFNM